MNATNCHVPCPSLSSKNKSGGSLRLMKWLVLIVLLVLLLLALFLPDRTLAAPDARPTDGEISAIKLHMRSGAAWPESWLLLSGPSSIVSRW